MFLHLHQSLKNEDVDVKGSPLHFNKQSKVTRVLHLFLRDFLFLFSKFMFLRFKVLTDFTAEAKGQTVGSIRDLLD